MSRTCTLSAVQGNDWLLQAVDVLGNRWASSEVQASEEGPWAGRERRDAAERCRKQDQV